MNIRSRNIIKIKVSHSMSPCIFSSITSHIFLVLLLISFGFFQLSFLCNMCPIDNIWLNCLIIPILIGNYFIIPSVSPKFRSYSRSSDIIKRRRARLMLPMLAKQNADKEIQNFSRNTCFLLRKFSSVRRFYRYLVC